MQTLRVRALHTLTRLRCLSTHALVGTLVIFLNLPCSATSAQSIIYVPVQIIRLANDDGSEQAEMSLAEAVAALTFANIALLPANVQFLFSAAADYTTVWNSTFNHLNGQVNVHPLTENFPGKMPVMVHRGCNGFSNTEGDAVYSGDWRNCTYNDTRIRNKSHLAHELGHHLGLPHTFNSEYNNADLQSNLNTASSDLSAHSNNPDFWDGDGFSDTASHPQILQHGNAGGPSQFTLNGVTIQLPRTNIMSYFQDGSTITPQQAARIRWWASDYQSRGWHYPTNLTAQQFVEGDLLSIAQATSAPSEFQSISDFGPPFSLIADDHLWIRFSNGGSITFNFTVASAGTYDFKFYGLRATARIT